MLHTGTYIVRKCDCIDSCLSDWKLAVIHLIHFDKLCYLVHWCTDHISILNPLFSIINLLQRSNIFVATNKHIIFSRSIRAVLYSFADLTFLSRHASPCSKTANCGLPTHITRQFTNSPVHQFTSSPVNKSACPPVRIFRVTISHCHFMTLLLCFF